jgi:hypothetical protein
MNEQELYSELEKAGCTILRGRIVIEVHPRVQLSESLENKLYKHGFMKGTDTYSHKTAYYKF